MSQAKSRSSQSLSQVKSVVTHYSFRLGKRRDGGGMRGPGHFLVPSLSSIHDLCCLSLDWSSDFSFPSNHLPPCRISLVFLLTLCSILFPSRWTASPSNSFANGSDHPHHRHYYPFPHRHPPLATKPAPIPWAQGSPEVFCQHSVRARN